MESAGGTLVRLRPELAWQDFDIPSGNMPVQTVRLQNDEPTRALTLLVRFPDGWERAAAGSYDCAEEFVVLEGALLMNGMTYRPDDWVYVPASVQRKNTSAPAGALALARFAGPVRWRAGDGEAPMLRATPLGGLDFDRDLGIRESASPFGGRAILLHAERGVSSWVLDAPPSLAAGVPFDVELLSVEQHVWGWFPSGSPFPRLEGRFFCRTFEAGVGSGSAATLGGLA
jgi:hypothetical protein